MSNKISLREALAELCHNQWSGWMEYLFSKGTFNDDGTWTMPAWAVERWQRQMTTFYEALPESEQDSDRKEADRFLWLLSNVLLDGDISGKNQDKIYVQAVDLANSEKEAIGKFILEILLPE